MAKKLSFSIAVNLLTDQFKQGANTVKNSFRSMQMQVLTFAAALGAGGLGLMGLLSRFRDVARETSRVLTALKNVSDGTRGFADNLRFVNDMAKTYGLEVNALIGNFAKFTASATQANMPMEQQKKVFESLSRATAAFGLSAEQTDGVFLALSQMMGKGKISSEELRKQMGEKLPIAMQAMAKAAGVSMGKLEELLKQGKLMSADMIPKFADALNEMLPNVDTNNLESSINRLSNAFAEIVNSSGFQNKYKALIDWLTELIKSAGKNIQNIVIGVVAAITFVVTKGLTNVYRSYAATGQQIVANAAITHNKLRAAIVARVAAEKRLEELKLQQAQATGAKQISLAKQVEQAKQTLSARTAAVTKAHENAKVAAAQAAAIKSKGAWATAGAAIVGTFKRIGASIKSMWNAFSPAIIISGVIALVMYFKNLYNESKRIKNIFSDYKNEAKNVGNTQEVKMLQAQLAIMNDKTKSQKEVNAAQAALQKMLGTEKLTQEEINKRVAKRIELLKTAAEADFYAQKAVETKDKIRNQASTLDKDVKGISKDLGLGDEQYENLARLKSNPETTDEYWKELNKIVGVSGKQVTFKQTNVRKAINDAIGETIEDLKVLDDAEKYLLESGNKANVLAADENNDPDEKALRAAEKRLEALRKLDEEDRKRQIEKRKFDLDMQQKAIDGMADSFEKQTKQAELNLEKEKLSIEEFQSDLLKQQAEHAKTLYESIHGDTKGFEAYFTDLKKNSFKGKDGIDIMPEGLRPADITDKVNQMLAAAQSAFDKANSNIAKESAELLEKERLVFEGELTQAITSIKNHYKELKKQYAENSKEYKELQALEDKEIELAKLAYNRKVLDLMNDLSEKQLALTDKSYLLQSKRELALLRLRQKNNASLIENLKQEFNLVVGKDFSSLSDDELQALITEYPELISLIQNAIIEQARLNRELTAIPNKSFKEIFGIVSNAVAELSNLEGEVGSFFSSVGSQLGNLQVAFDKEATSADKYSAAISGIVSIITMITSASQRRKQAEQEYYKNAIAFAHEYTLALNEQLRVNSELSQSGFIKDYAGQLNDGYNALENAVNSYYESISKLSEGKVKIDLVNAVDWGNVGKGAAAGAAAGAVIGSIVPIIGTVVGGLVGGLVGAVAGLFGGKKKKNEFAGLLDVFPGLVDGAGNLNRELAEAMVNTEQTDENTKQLLQNALDWADAIEEANNQIKEIVLELAGDLGGNLKTAIVDAWKAGEDASKKMFDVAGKSLEGFIENLLYSTVFGDIFKKFENELAQSLNPLTGDGDIVDDYLRLIHGLDERDDAYIALLESIKNRPETAGFGLWENEKTSQDSTKGYSVQMDQDTGGAILGRITGIHESILEIKNMMSGISIGTASYLTQTVSIGDELRKHTAIFDEMQQLQVKSYNLNKEIKESLGALPDMKTALDDISNNTKNL